MAVHLDKIILSLLSIVYINNAYAQYDFYLQTDIYKSSDWHNLLHYEKGKSVIDKNSAFFLSPEGYKNPKAEYIATIKEFLNTDNLNDKHAICRYPARFNYILQTLNLSADKFPKPNCYDYTEYKNKVPFEKISIIFAAENNISPSTMLGHSFLKIEGQNKAHSFSYFAAFDTTNSLNFYTKVLTSGIDGMYILSPYRVKQNEYINKEKRSLWEFELQLNENEKEKLKAHLW